MSDPTNDPTQPPEEKIFGEKLFEEKPLTREEMAAGITELLGLPEAEPEADDDEHNNR